MRIFNVERETIKLLMPFEEGEELLQFLIDNRLINKEKMRNAIIIIEFDKRVKKGDVLITDVYDDLAEEFEISYARVRQIVRNRKTHEIKFC